MADIVDSELNSPWFLRSSQPREEVVLEGKENILGNIEKTEDCTLDRIQTTKTLAAGDDHTTFLLGVFKEEKMKDNPWLCVVKTDLKSGLSRVHASALLKNMLDCKDIPNYLKSCHFLELTAHGLLMWDPSNGEEFVLLPNYSVITKEKYVNEFLD